MTTHVATMDRAPEPGIQVYNLKLGMWVFLLSEVMFFTGLIGSYIILRFAHPEHFAQPGQILNVPLTAFNTFVLICSSVTMVKAFAAIEQGDQAGLKKWLLATIVWESRPSSIRFFPMKASSPSRTRITRSGARGRREAR
jgi:heme/copper-type cytochrome/quinol oxidase subunit 3